MLKMSRCLLTVCAAGFIAVAGQATAQDSAVVHDGEPMTTPPPPPHTEPAPAATYTETTTTETTETASTPATRTRTTTTTAAPAETYVESEEAVRQVDTAAGYTYPNRRMLSAGAGLLALSYLPAVIVGAAGDYENDHYLYYPVAGPWLYMARHPHDGGSKALLAIDGILQDVAAIEILLSFVVPQRENRARWYAFGDREVRVLPGVSQYNAGLFASGRF